MLSLPMTVFAEDASELPDGINESYKEYLKLVGEGIVGEDVTYEYWCSIIERSIQLEDMLEQSSKFECVAVFQGNANTLADSTYIMCARDVFITNGTSSKGLYGHAGIVISSSEILHIAGPNKTPKTVTLCDWTGRYNADGWTKVYRHSSSSTAVAAAKWAERTYKGSSAEYEITLNLASTDVTYCSKIVWQAYYYGPASHCANGSTTGVCLPYDLPTRVQNLTLHQTFNKLQ